MGESVAVFVSGILIGVALDWAALAVARRFRRAKAPVVTVHAGEHAISADAIRTYGYTDGQSNIGKVGVINANDIKTSDYAEGGGGLERCKVKYPLGHFKGYPG